MQQQDTVDSYLSWVKSMLREQTRSAAVIFRNEMFFFNNKWPRPAGTKLLVESGAKDRIFNADGPAPGPVPGRRSQARPCLQTADVPGLSSHLSGVGRGDLTDQQWQRLEPLLPEKPQRGRPNEDHRQILNGILWIERTGAPWRDLPRRYGPVGTASSRFYRWRKVGIWQRILSDLQAEAHQRGEIDWDLHFVDATIVRAHQHAAGARLRPRAAAGDKGYSSRTARARLRRRHIQPVIPTRKNQPRQRNFDRAADRLRNRVERLINRLKQAWRIATRYEKRADNYRAMIHIGMILLWLKPFADTA